MTNQSGYLPLLLRLEARRAADAFRHPRPGAWIALLLPAGLVVGGLAAAGASARPNVATGDGQGMLGLIVSWPIAFQAYPALFRPADDAFLRRLGIPARAGFGLRALRLLAVALAVVLALMVPYVATNQPIAKPLGVALGSALVAWAASLWATARAGEKTVSSAYRPGLLAATMSLDKDLVKAAPLVFAPLIPVALATFAGRLLGAEAIPMGIRVGAVAILVVPMVFFAARRFERAYPRFAPHTAELAYAPPPGAGETSLVIDRGLARLLPRRAAAVRARDAVVVDRRFRWAGRAVAPVAVASVLALLRAGGDADVRGAVAAACALLLGMQGAAVIALGRLERGRLRWMDRANGLTTMDRLVGRWAAGFGLALGLVLPVAIVWSFSVPTSPGWPWLLAGAAGAAAASAASVAAAGR